MPRKLIEIHPDVLDALEILASDRMASLQELADEAFYDLLRKHGRPVGLKASLKKSATPTGATRRRKRFSRKK